MALFDDGFGSLLDLLRPTPAVARLEARAEAPIFETAAVLRVLEPSARAAQTSDALPRREHVRAVEAAAWRLSRVLAESRTALVSPREGSGDASLAWFVGAAAAPRLCMAAWIQRGTRRRRSRVRVDADVCCDVCGCPCYAAGRELRWLGARSSVELELTPICARCLGATARDPELWQRTVGRARSRLRLVSGEGAGGSPQRARLRVVRSD